MAQIRWALMHHILDHCHGDQEWEWGGRRGPAAPASVKQRLPQADHCKWGQPGTVTMHSLKGSHHHQNSQQTANNCFLLLPPTHSLTHPWMHKSRWRTWCQLCLKYHAGFFRRWIPNNLNLSLLMAWWCMVHLKNNNLSRTRKGNIPRLLFLTI